VDTRNNFSAAQETPDSALSVSAALLLIGFSAVIAQIVLMRELMVVFSGNEMSLGIMLAAWLFWTAMGSFLGSVLKVRNAGSRGTVAVLEVLLGASFPFTIWALRASKNIFQSVPGELVGPVPALISSLACLSVVCLAAGALFAAAARMYGREREEHAKTATSAAYWLEAAGSGAGGIFASLVLVRYLDPFQIAGIVLVLNLLMAVVLLRRMSPRQIAIAAAVAAAVGAVLLGSVAPGLERAALDREWRGMRLIASRDTIYGNLAVTQTGNIRCLYENGLVLANSPDESAAEESVDYALLEHPAPQRILMIGGGASGSVAQALRHPGIERIDLVELDPALIDVARKYFPAESAPAFADARVHLHFADGRAYLKSTRDKFDGIIVNVPAPQTAQLNRFYTVEFFRIAHDHLAPGGLLALQLRSSDETISPDLAEFLRCINHTMREVFPYVVAIPGETIHFFGAMRPDVLTDNPRALVSRLLARNLKTQYVREYFIPFRMMPDRMEQVQGELRPLATTKVNRDFTPIAYYFDVVLWSAQFKPDYAGWLRTAEHASFTSVLGATLLIIFVAAFVFGLMSGQERRARAAAGWCMGATGFTLMALEIFLLLAFQSIYGYVYHQLAMLIALCMAGIAFGSWLGLRQTRRENGSSCQAVALTQFLLAFSFPALMLIISLLARASGVMTNRLASECVFPGLAALSGMAGGYQFPMTSRIYLQGRSGGRRLGMLYAIDLLGGCLGALLLSGYLIPVFGFWKTAWLCMAVELAPALLAFTICARQRPQR